MAQGSFGKLKAFNDFLDQYSTVVLTGATPLGGGVALIGVNEGSIASTVDEPGGVLAITTDTADNDNHFLVAGPFKPQDGGCIMETRFKITTNVLTTTLAIGAGFSETLDPATPVMPAEFSTATLTVNGTGSMAMMLFDTDGTVIDWRSVIADAGAVVAGTACDGSVASATIAADRWYIVRVKISPDGIAEISFGDNDSTKEMKVLAKNTAVLDKDECYYAFLGIENRSGNARVMEVDYFGAEGWRDWSPS
jgi:hypothetical protein